MTTPVQARAWELSACKMNSLTRMSPTNRPEMPQRHNQVAQTGKVRVQESPSGSTGAKTQAALRPEVPSIVQEHPADAPAGWVAVQEKLAAATGLSVLLVDGRQPPALVASNNNSICHAFQSSMEY